MIHGLTPRQSDVLTFITGYEAKHSYAPSFDEIADALGLRSKSNVHRLVHQLIDRGAVQMMPSRARSITVLRTAEHDRRAVRVGRAA